MQLVINTYEDVGALPLTPEAGARPKQLHLDSIKKIIQEFIAIRKE